MSEATPGSERYPPKSRVRRAAPVAVTLVQSVSRTITIAGFPLSTWAFALRIWAAMMVALYAAFWLQLESASSAAVTVGILALPTRGQTYQKARLPDRRHHHRGCRLIRDRWVVRTESQPLRDRVRGLAWALRLRGWTFGRQQGLQRRLVRLYSCPGRYDADRLATEHFLGWHQ